MEKEGFSGHDGRTTIFDYWRVESICRGFFSRDELTTDELRLEMTYKDILNIARSEKAVSEGKVFDLMYVNQHLWSKQFAFLRKAKKEMLIVVANFSSNSVNLPLIIPSHAFESTEAPEAPGADSLDFEDAAALRDFLIGVWSYFPAEEDAVDSPEITGIPGISIQLLEDGSFYAIRQTDGVRFQGSWKLEHYFAEEGALPDRISFTLEEGGAPGAFGDYWIQGWASCAGTDRLLLTNIIYDADTFASFPEIYDAMLVKGSYDPDAEGSAPNCDAEFCGIVWQVTDGGTALWITEISPVDFTLAVGSRIAARYPVAADAELGYPVSVFARGGCPAVVKTNAAGEIVYLNWAERDMEGN